MRRINKLTPEKIKQIILEERQKIKNEKQLKLYESLVLLKKIKKKQIKSLKEAKQLNELKLAIVKKLKGKK